MADMDLIARVYPYGYFQKAIENTFRRSSLFVPPLIEVSEPLPTYGRGERESTEPPKNSNIPDHCWLPCIEIKSSTIPRSRHGIVFGSKLDSDVVLPDLQGISGHHFTVTFDEERRPIVKDWGSLIGTEVTYDDQGHGVRSGFQWIVGGHRVPHKKKILITLKTTSSVQLWMVLPNHMIASREYIDKVDRFRRGTASADDLFRGLEIPNRPETQRPTGAHTPGSGSIHLRKVIGEGSFAVVTHFWNVSTGEEYALKKPSLKAVRGRRVDFAAWRNEAHVMGLISHVCITPACL